MATAGAETRPGASGGRFRGNGRGRVFTGSKPFRLPGLELPVAWNLRISTLAEMLTWEKSRQSGPVNP